MRDCSVGLDSLDSLHFNSLAYRPFQCLSSGREHIVIPVTTPPAPASSAAARRLLQWVKMAGSSSSELTRREWFESSVSSRSGVIFKLCETS